MPPPIKVDPVTGEIITCDIEDCPKTPIGRGWCDAHYRRWIKYGDPLGVAPPRTYQDPAERFWRRVNKNGPCPDMDPDLGPCWLWTGPLSRKGYAQFSVTRDWERTNWPVHGFAYEQMVGRVPDGLELDHLCCVRHCVNPDHLEPVTHEENIARAKARGSYARQWEKTTHCPQGHEYTDDNTYVDPDGVHFCRTCLAAKKRRQTARRLRELEKRDCAWCDAKFQPLHPRQKYCGDDCQSESDRKRAREATARCRARQKMRVN
jgi:hypothetical protein